MLQTGIPPLDINQAIADAVSGWDDLEDVDRTAETPGLQLAQDLREFYSSAR